MANERDRNHAKKLSRNEFVRLLKNDMVAVKLAQVAFFYLIVTFYWLT